MWQQGVISEDDYRNAAAQPLVLAEDTSKKNTSSVTSYFTDALFNEVVGDIMEKEGVDEATAQNMLYTAGSIHNFHPATGSGTQTGIYRSTNDDDRTTLVRIRIYHLYAYGLRQPVGICNSQQQRRYHTDDG